jgi:hypothetical protein
VSCIFEVKLRKLILLLVAAVAVLACGSVKNVVAGPPLQEQEAVLAKYGRGVDARHHQRPR